MYDKVSNSVQHKDEENVCIINLFPCGRDKSCTGMKITSYVDVRDFVSLVGAPFRVVPSVEEQSLVYFSSFL